MEKEDLSLSLRLSSLLPSTTLVHSPEKRFSEMPLLGGLDIMSQSAEESEEIDGRKRREREASNGAGDERASISDDDDGGDDGCRKKLRLSKDQAAVLEESFREHPTLNPKQKQKLAAQLNLRPRQVEVWFQNRRARTKLKQTEVDCEFLKRCCENLTAENRRLHKEVQELRALKLISPQLYMNMKPPTTLALCPSCERISNSSNSQLCHRPIAVRPPVL